VTTLDNNRDLVNWLTSHAWLRDAYVDELVPLPSGTESNPPQHIRIAIRQQIAGSLVAGERRRMRQLILTATAVSVFTLAEDGFVAGNCCQGAEVHDDSDAPLSFGIDVPLDLRLDCAHMDVSEREWDEDVPAWFSDREFSAIVLDSRLPSPTEWVRIFRDKGRLVAWRYWGGPEVDTATVPADYEGWYLQYTDRLQVTNGGLFFFTAKQQHNGFCVSLQVNDADERSLWRACATHVGTFPNAKIHCGNVVLTGTEWLSHVGAMTQPITSGA